MNSKQEKKYPCPCCGNLTLSEEGPGTYEICKQCGWEDDLHQFRNPDSDGGANKLSLNQAKKKCIEEINDRQK
ncbi:MAG: CPCC family cysteine-rich protein [Anaerovoracaceae bacterium]